MQIGHRVLLHACAPCRVHLRLESDARATHSHRLLQHQRSLKERCNHLPIGEALHHADLPESLLPSSQLRLAYPMGEAGDEVRQ